MSSTVVTETLVGLDEVAPLVRGAGPVDGHRPVHPRIDRVGDVEELRWAHQVATPMRGALAGSASGIAATSSSGTVMKRPYGATARIAAAFRCEERGIVANRRPGPADRCRARPRRPAELRRDRGASRALGVGGQAPNRSAVPRGRDGRLLGGREPGAGRAHRGVRRAVLRGSARPGSHRAGARPPSAGDRRVHRERRAGRPRAPPDERRRRARRRARADPDGAPRRTDTELPSCSLSSSSARRGSSKEPRSP